MGNNRYCQEKFGKIHVSALPKTVTVGLELQEPSEAANNPTGHCRSNGLLREMHFIPVTTTPKAAEASKTLCSIRPYLKQF